MFNHSNCAIYNQFIQQILQEITSSKHISNQLTNQSLRTYICKPSNNLDLPKNNRTKILFISNSKDPLKYIVECCKQLSLKEAHQIFDQNLSIRSVNIQQKVRKHLKSPFNQWKNCYYWPTSLNYQQIPQSIRTVCRILAPKLSQQFNKIVSDKNCLTLSQLSQNMLKNIYYKANFKAQKLQKIYIQLQILIKMLKKYDKILEYYNVKFTLTKSAALNSLRSRQLDNQVANYCQMADIRQLKDQGVTAIKLHIKHNSQYVTKPYITKITIQKQYANLIILIEISQKTIKQFDMKNCRFIYVIEKVIAILMYFNLIDQVIFISNKNPSVFIGFIDANSWTKATAIFLNHKYFPFPSISANQEQDQDQNQIQNQNSQSQQNY